MDRAIAHPGRWWIAGFITFGKQFQRILQAAGRAASARTLARPATVAGYG
jgi:hypothetical protein